MSTVQVQRGRYGREGARPLRGERVAAKHDELPHPKRVTFMHRCAGWLFPFDGTPREDPPPHDLAHGNRPRLDNWA